jgi:hypothetical protein
VALFAVVLGCLLASVVALGRAGWSVDELTDEPTNPQQQREQLMTVASSFVTRLDTYGPADLDDADKLTRYVDRVEELMTAKAFSLFERGVPIIEVSVAQSRYSSKSEVYDTGVAEMDDDSARVLVAGTVVLSGADEKRKRVVLDSRTFRFEVALIRSGGEWLVDDYGTVGTLDQPVELPPTDAPAPSGAPSPTGEGGQQ